MKLWKDHDRVHWIEAETLHLQNARGKGTSTPTFQSVFSLETHK